MSNNRTDRDSGKGADGLTGAVYPKRRRKRGPPDHLGRNCCHAFINIQILSNNLYEPTLGGTRQEMAETKHYYWLGAVLGAVLFFILAQTGVLVSVPTGVDDNDRFRFEIIVLGVEVFRYPEDGDLYQMKPVPQAIAAERQLIAGSTIAGAIVGYATAFVLHRLVRRKT